MVSESPWNASLGSALVSSPILRPKSGLKKKTPNWARIMCVARTPRNKCCECTRHGFEGKGRCTPLGCRWKRCIEVFELALVALNCTAPEASRPPEEDGQKGQTFWPSFATLLCPKHGPNSGPENSPRLKETNTTWKNGPVFEAGIWPHFLVPWAPKTEPKLFPKLSKCGTRKRHPLGILSWGTGRQPWKGSSSKG